MGARDSPPFAIPSRVYGGIAARRPLALAYLLYICTRAAVSSRVESFMEQLFPGVTWFKSSGTNRVPEFRLAVCRLLFTKRNVAAHSAAMPKIIFVRHGQAAHNAAFDSLGTKAYKDRRYRDSKLTQTGLLADY
jgi:hypothetical protein